MEKYQVYDYKGELVVQDKQRQQEKDESFDWRKCLTKDFLVNNKTPVSLCVLAACDSIDLVYHQAYDGGAINALRSTVFAGTVFAAI